MRHISCICMPTTRTRLQPQYVHPACSLAWYPRCSYNVEPAQGDHARRTTISFESCTVACNIQASSPMNHNHPNNLPRHPREVNVAQLAERARMGLHVKSTGVVPRAISSPWRLSLGRRSRTAYHRQGQYASGQVPSLAQGSSGYPTQS